MISHHLTSTMIPISTFLGVGERWTNVSGNQCTRYPGKRPFLSHFIAIMSIVQHKTITNTLSTLLYIPNVIILVIGRNIGNNTKNREQLSENIIDNKLVINIACIYEVCRECGAIVAVDCRVCFPQWIQWIRNTIGIPMYEINIFTWGNKFEDLYCNKSYRIP